ncbi:MAG: hypothetical protein H7Y17_04235 [Chlorobia bacterium]|nr:hypothetical protein [Fimbriimonadaceae bacterium]
MDDIVRHRRMRNQSRRVRYGTVVLSKVVHTSQGQDIVFGSGFVYARSNEWILITASHAIDKFEEIAEDKREDQGGNWLFLKVPASNGPPVKFNLRTSQGFGLPALGEALLRENPDDERKGFFRACRESDIAFIVLPRRIKSLLKKAGLKPFTTENVRMFKQEEIHSAHKLEGFLFGVPMNSLEFDQASVETSYYFKQLSVYVSDVAEESYLVVFGRNWSDQEHTGSINGMSGGPIVVLGHKEPAIIAVQSKEFFAETSDRESSTPDTLWAFEFAHLQEVLTEMLIHLKRRSNLVKKSQKTS